VNAARALQGHTWAIEPRAFSTFFGALENCDIVASAQVSTQASAGTSGSGYVLSDNGDAVIQFRGPVLQGFGWLAEYGFRVADPDIISAELSAAIADESVKSITIEFDSPGGIIGGVADLSDLVAQSSKPITAKIAGLCCSAAFWVASGAREIVANQTATIGSIGVFVTAYDFSKQFESMGVKAHVVASHKLKGVGSMGAEITKEQIEDIARNVNTFAKIFNAAVERGRGLTGKALESVATGQVWIGQEAVEMGLADKIAAFGGGTAGQTEGARASATLKGENMPELEERVSALESKCADLEERVSALESHEGEGAATEPEKKEKEPAALAVANKALRASLFAQYGDRLTPALRKSLASVDPTDLEGVLEALPTQAVRTEPQGQNGVQAVAASDADSAEDEEFKKAQAFFDVSDESMKKAAAHESLTMAVLYPEKFGGA
jgi:signal peptide peptidase SppA